jgi:hypothetical protein
LTETKELIKLAFCGKMGTGKTLSTLISLGLLKDKLGDNSSGFVIKFAQPIYAALRALHRAEKARVWMQRFGDLSRREFGDDVFERIFEENFVGLTTNELPNRPEQYVLIMTDDCRFIKEYELVKNLGFTVIRLDTDDEIRARRIGDTFTNTKHRSEIELEQFEPEYIIENNEENPEAPELTEKIRILLEQICPSLLTV